MNEIYFVVKGKAQPKQRPRFSNGHTYTPKPTLDYEKKIREAYLSEDFERLSGPLEMVLNFYFEIPKSTPKKLRDQMLIAKIRPTKRNGDVDNLFKVVADALNDVAYDDDAQIVQATVNKWYGREPLVEISIRSLADGREG